MRWMSVEARTLLVGQDARVGSAMQSATAARRCRTFPGEALATSSDLPLGSGGLCRHAIGVATW